MLNDLECLEKDVAPREEGESCEMPSVSLKQCGGVLERDLTFEAESQCVAATDGWRGVTRGYILLMKRGGVEVAVRD